MRDFFGVGRQSVGAMDSELAKLVNTLAKLSEQELRWVDRLLKVALARKT